MNSFFVCEQCGRKVIDFEVINGKLLCAKHIAIYEEHEKEGTQFEYWNSVFPLNIKK